MTVLHTQAAAAAITKEGEIRNDGNETKMTKNIKEKKNKEEERGIKGGFCGFSLQLKTSLISCAPFPCIIRPSKSRRKLFRTNCEDHNQTTN
jgi:hypothetical protein